MQTLLRYHRNEESNKGSKLVKIKLIILQRYTGKKTHNEQISFNESKEEEKKKDDVFEMKPTKTIPICGDIMLKFKNNGMIYFFVFLCLVNA